MFDPTLFGLQASQYKDFGMSILTVTVFLTVVYLLSLPLRKIPFIDAIEDYTPPDWVLPVFTTVSVATLIFCFTVSLRMAAARTEPNPQLFLQSFFKRYPITPPSGGKLTSAYIDILAYDRLSNFRVFVNGYRLFGTNNNCNITLQCRDLAASDSKTLKEDWTKFWQDTRYLLSIHRTTQPYFLPHREDFIGLIVNGPNFIDIYADNSGAEVCRNIQLGITMATASSSTSRVVSMNPNAGEDKVVKLNEDTYQLEYSTGGNASRGAWIEPYHTSTNDQTKRLCERLRFDFTIENDQAPSLQDNTKDWTSWLRTRMFAR